MEEAKEVQEETEKVDTQTTEEKEAKTFTQEEVNLIVQERLNKQKKNLPTKEELDAFKEWKESQKTEAEKQAEVIKENENLKAEVMELKNMSVVANAGVDSKFQKFVFSEVSKEGNFEENLQEYLKNNPQYLKGEEPKTDGVATKKIVSQDDGVISILKERHPNIKI